ncbi:MAG TPA: FtsQ-type POTRA domain-containing protein [Sediminibacterium sp.]
MKRYNWRKIWINTAWCIVGAATIVLLGAAMQRKSHKPCSDIRVEISGAEKHMFIDEKDVLDMLHTAGTQQGSPVNTINLRMLETAVEQNPWVKNAEMFLNNNQVLEVRITERQPVARIFTQDGYSFYVDSAGLRLPLSDELSARVPMFTGFPSDRPVLSKPDSALLHSLVNIGRNILADSFWMAQVSQVNITPEARFEIIPVIGDQVIALGTGDDIEGKLQRLYTFYKKAWLQNGINTYEKLDVQYDNQVVAIRKGTARAKADSAKARQIMDAMVSNPVVIPDSSAKTAVKPPVTVKPVGKDAVKTGVHTPSPEKSHSALPSKTKTVTNTNNKINKKPLSNKAGNAVKKKANPAPSSALKQPKAVMKNTHN